MFVYNARSRFFKLNFVFALGTNKYQINAEILKS